MNLLPFGELPVHTPRQLVPKQIDLGEWNQIAPLFDAVENKLASATSVAELEAALLAWSELSAVLDEEGAKRYIAMTCHTDNTAAEKTYLHFVEHVEPETKPRQFKLEQVYLAQPWRAQLPKPRYEVFDRDTKQRVELFRPENVPLETEEAKLGQQYQKLSGALTVQFRGEEKTLIQMGKYQEEPDRALRQEAWEVVAKRRLQETEKFEDLFDGLAKLRGQIAANAGFANYRDYAFKHRGRFDYTPEDCFAFHEAIEKEVMPLHRELQATRREQLKLGTLRPWDLSVDPLNRPPLKPFDKVDQMVERTQKMFDQIDGGLASGFRAMQDQRLLDLENRKGKAPGGYQSTLSESRLPFIFMNAVGLQRDVETILHEAGHAFHALATRDEPLYSYRGSPIEFCEVASMSMELLGNEFIEEFYSPHDANRARRTHLEGIVGIFPWIATVDAFQHWIYTHPNHTRAERSAAWLALMDRFGGAVDWTRHEQARANLWHKQLHIFLYPFYYVEYGIAQLGALQVWANSKQNKQQSLANYQRALALGNSRPLPELFAAAGCIFSFNCETVKPLVQLVKNELAKLN
ncbi:MAG TPA: M3 family oligoendopeptidase [Candidatus Limnocylindria bacterium]|nr:M3 family oligoendopeptidase [Candidatus Limnocylindria bacterium]